GRYALKRPKHVLVISGVSAESINRKLAEKCNRAIEGLRADVLAVKNRFFGETVTCTGLLTGEDILAAVLAYKEGGGVIDELVLPCNTLKEFEEVFLCGMTLEQLKVKSGVKNISVNREGGYGFVEILAKNKK
ncbi:MAG: DUF512 domain-containing protein, partial [Clostridia bacterium]|nr:DUF512 domain-containing protein [Clostridia bacterium]